MLELAQGNPGALMFIIALMGYANPLKILTLINDSKTLRGDNLYVLYSDLCNKDMELVERLFENCPVDIIEDACSRQDYSGRKLVHDYLDPNYALTEADFWDGDGSESQ